MRRKECKRKSNRKTWAGVGFILPGFAGVILLSLIPYLDVLQRAFVQTASGKFVGLDNFKNVIANEAFQQAAGNTLRLILICVPALVIVSLVIAVMLQNGVWYMNLFKNSFLIPMAIPVASVVLLWRGIFSRQGFLNGFLHLFGISGVDWMNSEYAFGVLVFSYVWKNLGYSIVLWIAGLATIPKEVYEAAKVDGAGWMACFWKITIPSLLSTFFTITVLSLINSFKVFREAYLVAGDYPHPSIYMMQHLFNNWFRDMALDEMAAGAVMNGAVMFALIWMFWRAWGAKE